MTNPERISDELRTCPFCGSDAVVVKVRGRPDISPWPTVICTGCAVRTEPCADEDRAITAWNRRSPPAQEGMVTVKPLEWETVSSRIFDATSSCGLYRVKRYDDHWSAFLLGTGFNAERFTAEAAKAAAQADYASRISSALLPIDAPAREGGGEWEALQAVVSAWEATKAGDTTVPEIQRWLIEDMKPAIDAARRILASHAEPAAHSLQTLAPASDAVKPGDET